MRHRLQGEGRGACILMFQGEVQTVGRGRWYRLERDGGSTDRIKGHIAQEEEQTAGRGRRYGLQEKGERQTAGRATDCREREEVQTAGKSTDLGRRKGTHCRERKEVQTSGRGERYRLKGDGRGAE